MGHGHVNRLAWHRAPMVYWIMDLPADRLRTYKEIARRLCGHQTVPQIARVLDRTPATIRKWMRDSVFQKILQEMDESIWAHVMSELKQQASKSLFDRAEEDSEDAYSVLHEIMEDKDAAKALRRQCAIDVLEIAGKRKPVDGPKDIGPTMSPIHITILGETIRQVHGVNDGKASSTTPSDSKPGNGQSGGGVLELREEGGQA